MNPYNRKSFLRKMIVAGFGAAFLPKLVNGRLLDKPVLEVASLPNPGKFEPNDFGIVDLHCHPSLKMYLWGRKLWRRHKGRRLRMKAAVIGF
jgi:hypothetical protein